MKLFLSIGFGWFLDSPAPWRLSRTSIPSNSRARTMLRLTRWARINEFEVGWLKRDETLLLPQGANRIQVTVDSCEARINGVQVMLVAPVASHNGYLFVPLIDSKRPFPPSSPRRVCLRVRPFGPFASIPDTAARTRVFRARPRGKEIHPSPRSGSAAGATQGGIQSDHHPGQGRDVGTHRPRARSPNVRRPIS